MRAYLAPIQHLKALSALRGARAVSPLLREQFHLGKVTTFFLQCQVLKLSFKYLRVTL